MLELQFSYAVNAIMQNIVKNAVNLRRVYSNSDQTTVYPLTVNSTISLFWLHISEFTAQFGHNSTLMKAILSKSMYPLYHPAKKDGGYMYPVYSVVVPPMHSQHSVNMVIICWTPWQCYCLLHSVCCCHSVMLLKTSSVMLLTHVEMFSCFQPASFTLILHFLVLLLAGCKM